MLQNNFFTIDSTFDSESIEVGYVISLNAEHPIYKAHFPGQPITPGVCILQIVIELLSNFYHFELELVEVKNIKYLAVITPDTTTKISVVFNKIEITGGEISAQAIVADDTTKFSKLSLKCKKKTT